MSFIRIEYGDLRSKSEYRKIRARKNSKSSTHTDVAWRPAFIYLLAFCFLWSTIDFTAVAFNILAWTIRNQIIGQFWTKLLIVIVSLCIKSISYIWCLLLPNYGNWSCVTVGSDNGKNVLLNWCACDKGLLYQELWYFLWIE